MLKPDFEKNKFMNVVRQDVNMESIYASTSAFIQKIDTFKTEVELTAISIKKNNDLKNSRRNNHYNLQLEMSQTVENIKSILFKYMNQELYSKKNRNEQSRILTWYLIDSIFGEQKKLHYFILAIVDILLAIVLYHGIGKGEADNSQNELSFVTAYEGQTPWLMKLDDIMRNMKYGPTSNNVLKTMMDLLISIDEFFIFSWKSHEIITEEIIIKEAYKMWKDRNLWGVVTRTDMYRSLERAGEFFQDCQCPIDESNDDFKCSCNGNGKHFMLHVGNGRFSMHSFPSMKSLVGKTIQM
jgi:hypothetical protein